MPDAHVQSIKKRSDESYTPATDAERYARHGGDGDNGSLRRNAIEFDALLFASHGINLTKSFLSFSANCASLRSSGLIHP